MKTILFACVLASTSLAMASDFAPTAGSTPAYVLHGPAGGTPSAFVGMATGDFDHDHLQDLAYFKGTDLQVTFAPGMFDTTHKSTLQGSALASIPTNAIGTQHSLLMTSANGLQRLDWTTSANGNSMVASSLNAPTWAAMSDIKIHVSSAGMVIAGLSTDRKVVHLMHTSDLFLSQNTTWASLGTKAKASVIDDFELANLNSSGLPELAIACNDALEVRSLPLMGMPPTYTSTFSGFTNFRLARVANHLTGKEWFTTLSDYSLVPDAQFVHLFGATSMLYGIDLTSTTSQVLLMQAADYDLNGIDDLVFSLGGDYDIGVLFASNAMTPEYELSTTHRQGQIFASAARFSPSVAGVPGSNVARPGVLDVDNDGDMDLCIPTHDDQSIWIYKESAVADHLAWTPTLLVDSQTDSGVYLLGSGISAAMLNVPTMAPGADAIELLVWQKPGPAAEMVSEPSARVFFPWSAIGTKTYQRFSFQLQDEPNARFDEILFMSLRQVSLDTTGTEVTRTYPAYVFMFHAAGTSTAHEQFVNSIPGSTYFMVEDRSVYGLGPVNGGGGHDSPCVPFGGNGGPNSGSGSGG